MDYSTYIFEVIFMSNIYKAKKTMKTKYSIVIIFNMYEIVIQSNEIPNLNMKIP